MPRKNLRRAASKEALKQMQLLSATAYEDAEDAETLEITSDDDVVSVDMPPKKKYRLSHRKSSDGNDRDVIVLKTVTPDEETMKLETWVEELSSVQLAALNKSEEELKEINSRIEKITSHPNTEVIFEGESSSAYQLDSSVIPALALPDETNNETDTDITDTNTTKPGQPKVVIQPTKPNNTQNAYQLVVDPRLGLIVGTVTPAAAASTTAPAKPAAAGGTTSSMPPPPLTKIQTPVPVVPTRPRRRGRNSVQVAQQPQTPASTPVSAPTPPKQQKTSSSVVHLRPTESTAVGGLSTSPGGTVSKTNTNNAPTISSVVDLTTDDGRPAPDTREISFNKLQGKNFPSLVVVARPHLSVKDITGGDRTKLDSKVKSVLMHVPTKFTEWLIQQGLVRSEQNCANHPNTKLKLGMYSDVSKFPYSGGYVWISECCPHRFVSVFSGSLFEGSPHPPSVILKLIYHWSCQTNVQNVVQWVKVDNLYVKGMNTWLRAICSVALQSHISPLGGPGCRVEVGVISLGTTSQDGQQRQVKVEVLGVLESDLKRIRLRAVEPLVDADRNYKKRFAKILEPLLLWVDPSSTIVTDLTVDKSTLHSMGFSHVQQSTSSDHNASNHTVMEYLRRIVPRMFQNTLSLLSRQIIQQFLDELVWREWYGTTAAQCFDNLLTHLSEQTRADTGHSLIMRLNKVAANPFKSWTVTTSTQPMTIINKPQLNNDASSSLPTKRTSNRQRKIINVRASSPATEIQSRPPRTLSPDVPEQMVPLENYYYGTIEGIDSSSNPKIGWNMKCSLCKTHFSNNIKLMGHLFSHAHNITGGVQQCRYCLSSVGSQEGLFKHISTSHPFETRFQEGFICVICEARFPNSFSLGKHLSKEHVPSELPYQCGTCGFRCSSHRQAVDHFYKTHDSGATIQCPFCLKSTTVWSGGRIMPQNLNFFMQHLQKHQKKAMAKKCPKCALWFIHKDTLKEHQMNMHTTQRRKGGLIAWSAPRNGLMVPKSKQDKQVWEDSERELDFSNLTIDAPNKLLCKECKMSINTPRHFQSLESCTNRNCQYTTFCKSAMDTHLKMCKTLNESLPVFGLAKAMFCVCGYSEDDGNILAKHLAVCERKSSYPTAEAAKNAIKTHSMLDVLGLVRRPEEPSNPASSNMPTATASPVIEVIDLDTDEKEERVKSGPKREKRRMKLKAARRLEKEKSIVIQDDERNKEIRGGGRANSTVADDDEMYSSDVKRVKYQKVDSNKKIDNDLSPDAKEEGVKSGFKRRIKVKASKCLEKRKSIVEDEENTETKVMNSEANEDSIVIEDDEKNTGGVETGKDEEVNSKKRIYHKKDNSKKKVVDGINDEDEKLDDVEDKYKVDNEEKVDDEEESIDETVENEEKVDHAKESDNEQLHVGEMVDEEKVDTEEEVVHENQLDNEESLDEEKFNIEETADFKKEVDDEEDKEEIGHEKTVEDEEMSVDDEQTIAHTEKIDDKEQEDSPNKVEEKLPDKKVEKDKNDLVDLEDEANVEKQDEVEKQVEGNTVREEESKTFERHNSEFETSTETDETKIDTPMEVDDLEDLDSASIKDKSPMGVDLNEVVEDNAEEFIATAETTLLEGTMEVNTIAEAIDINDTEIMETDELNKGAAE